LAAVAISPASASAAAQSFGYSGSVQTYTVPAGVNSLQVSATGGSGTGYYHADGGAGGTVNATIPATPGQTLDIYVGGNGGTPNGYSAPGGGGTQQTGGAGGPSSGGGYQGGTYGGFGSGGTGAFSGGTGGGGGGGGYYGGGGGGGSFGGGGGAGLGAG